MDNLLCSEENFRDGYLQHAFCLTEVSKTGDDRLSRSPILEKKFMGWQDVGLALGGNTGEINVCQCDSILYSHFTLQLIAS